MRNENWKRNEREMSLALVGKKNSFAYDKYDC